MKLYSENKQYKLYQGNMLDMLEIIQPNTIGSIITDPPYELNFMNKGWDNSGVALQPSTWQKCYEVLKPGGYLLAFGGSRTFHRIACAIEDAGFEIRDTIMWLYGSGFPKSMNISLMLDKKEGLQKHRGKAINTAGKGIRKDINTSNNTELAGVPYTECKSDLAKQWQGWGTALKPSFEPIIVARKPFKGSLVDNVIEYGVGGINIDECRADYNGEIPNIGGRAKHTRGDGYGFKALGDECKANTTGRFPANTILTYDETDFEEVCGGFPNTKSVKSARWGAGNTGETVFGKYDTLKNNYECGFNNSGSASRYFYCAKASKKDRDEGCQELEDTYNACSNQAIAEQKRGNKDFADINNSTFNKIYVGKNTHPTVKPTELMQYLVRLVSPNGATILDCFNGSGSTGKAVMYENKERNKGYKYIGIELTEEYLPIAKARIEYVCNLTQEELKEKQLSIFDLGE